MDASEIIRKLQSKAVFTYTKQQLAVTQPTANVSTCGANINAVLNFQDYQLRYSFYDGVKYCSTCSTGYPTSNVNKVCGCS
jgi:hypothetical protein